MPAGDGESLLVGRVRHGLWVIIAQTGLMTAVGFAMRPGPVAYDDTVRLYTLVALGLALWSLRQRQTNAAAIAVGLFAVAVTSGSVALIALRAGTVPTYVYIAIVMTTAAIFPWGLPAQAVAAAIVGAAYGWNATGLGAAPITSREVWSSVLTASSTLFIAWLLDRQRTMEARERAVLHQRQRALDDERRLLERRVTERTHDLTRANAALIAEITERRRVEEQLLLLADALPAYVAYVDDGGRYVWVNRSYEDYWKRSRTEIVGRPMRELHSPPAWAAVEGRIADALAGRIATVETLVTDPGGATRIFDITFVPDRTDDGAVVGFVVLGFDVTDRRAAEERDRRTDRLAALGTLAAGMAHEINNPAAGILAAAEMARTTLADADTASLDQALCGIIAEAQRCGQIVKSVLRLAREEPSERRPHDLAAVLQRAMELLRGESALAGARLTFDGAASTPLVPMNATEILQVVLNVTTNALRAGADTVTLRIEARGDHVAFAVDDNGRGMTEAERAQVFNPFFTTARTRGGTGLGLSVCHAIVARHGGRIDVRSAPGAGTTVTVELPLGAGALPAVEAPSLALTGTGS